jgi:hypothetical protein
MVITIATSSEVANPAPFDTSLMVVEAVLTIDMGLINWFQLEVSGEVAQC